MDWSKKAEEIKSKCGGNFEKHQDTALGHVQKKYRILKSLSLDGAEISRTEFTDGELIDICISCGFDSTDFSGLMDGMTGDFYARMEELCA